MKSALDTIEEEVFYIETAILGEVKGLYLKSDVEKASIGDAIAFERLISRVENKMYRVAKTVLRQDADCADAMQEALLRAWKSLPGLRDKTLFEAWLMRILVRECYRLLRRNKPVDMAAWENPDADAAVDLDTGIDMRRALSALPDHERMVLVLRYSLDYSVRNVSSILNIPEGTVKSRLYRGREHLAQIWKEIDR